MLKTKRENHSQATYQAILGPMHEEDPGVYVVDGSGMIYVWFLEVIGTIIFLVRFHVCVFAQFHQPS
jgi:hypothetical protein